MIFRVNVKTFFYTFFAVFQHTCYVIYLFALFFIFLYLYLMFLESIDALCNIMTGSSSHRVLMLIAISICGIMEFQHHILDIFAVLPVQFSIHTLLVSLTFSVNHTLSVSLYTLIQSLYSRYASFIMSPVLILIESLENGILQFIPISASSYL